MPERSMKRFRIWPAQRTGYVMGLPVGSRRSVRLASQMVPGLLSFLILADVTYAQQVIGTVQDSSGAPIVGATVMVLDTGRVFRFAGADAVRSGPGGHFTLNGVPPGPHRLSVHNGDGKLSNVPLIVDTRIGKITNVGNVVLWSVQPREVWLHCAVAVPLEASCNPGREFGFLRAGTNSVGVFRDSSGWGKFSGAKMGGDSSDRLGSPVDSTKRKKVDWSHLMLIVVGYQTMDNLLAGSYLDLNRVIYWRDSAIVYLGPDTLVSHHVCPPTCVDVERLTRVYEVPRTEGPVKFDYARPQSRELPYGTGGGGGVGAEDK